MIIAGFCYVHSFEVYLFVDYSSERINQEFNSFILALVFTNSWTFMVIVMPYSFFVNKPKRKKLFWKWMAGWCPPLKNISPLH